MVLGTFQSLGRNDCTGNDGTIRKHFNFGDEQVKQVLKDNTNPAPRGGQECIILKCQHCNKKTKEVMGEGGQQQQNKFLKRGGGGKTQTPSILVFETAGLLPPTDSSGYKACTGPTGEMMHNGQVRLPQACTTEIKRIP